LAELESAMADLERAFGKRFADPADPLLVSVRSGARASMPGMMDTVLNLGLSDASVNGLAERSGSPRFAWDAYRRFIKMYADVVLGVRSRGDEGCPFEQALTALKKKRKVTEDTDLDADDLRALVERSKEIVLAATGKPFPQDPWEQLRGAVAAVFSSWDNERAVVYRRMHRIPGDWGTACSIVAMVFGNLGPTSGTGVAFTRDPASGAKGLWGEYLANAQGEDVVAGLRTPKPISRLKEELPEAGAELARVATLLEEHYRDMQDLEFTVQEGRLYLLQCRSGKRTGPAAVRIAVDMVSEGRIDASQALLRVEAEAIGQLLEPVFEQAALTRAEADGDLLTTGLNAGPGAATGRIALSSARAVAQAAEGEPVILVRIETSPEDIGGMEASVGILTARGGMTSHAALVARQMGRVCVAGAGELEIDYARKRLRVAGRSFKEGDWISIDGTTGRVFAGRVPTRPSEVIESVLDPEAPRGPLAEAYHRLMAWADRARTMAVRTNADQADQCHTAIAFGAEGIGLCRTEHMFFGEGKIDAVREMILAENADERRVALDRLLPLQRADFEGIFEAMGTRPVTIRTLDPPLHEFLPHDEDTLRQIAASLGTTLRRLRTKIAGLAEQNPMLGHRGCRLGITYPEITRTQARALFEAACAVAKHTGVTPFPEVMIPLVGSAKELALQAQVVRSEARAVFDEQGIELDYLVGTMIELPRAALTADAIAEHAEFFSFGTNDLTQTTFGISRDDSGKFIPLYVERGILAGDPFASLDEAGVGKLLEIACQGGRATKPKLKLGICGEHGGDPRSVDFCQRLGLDYVSCSPYRVPIARLAAAQAALRHA
jgi:pyruvate, orthophosphate dikinase